VNSKT